MTAFVHDRNTPYTATGKEKYKHLKILSIRSQICVLFYKIGEHDLSCQLLTPVADRSVKSFMHSAVLAKAVL